MNRFHGDTATSENSSCTSCFYTSESDRLSLRQLKAQRSKINRLFRENCMPSKDIELIDKLVKTRGLYDDVRNQLLSGSNICVNEKAILKPIKCTPDMVKELKEAERSSDILAMIDFVDKGIVLGPKKLIQTCSCCSYNAKPRCHEYAQNGRRQKCAFTGGCITSNSSVISNGVAKHNVRFETKNIKSDPCTCTSKLEEFIKRRSNSLLKKNQPMKPTLLTEPTFLGYFPIDEHKIQSNKTSHLKPKRSEVHTLKNADGRVIGPITKLPQARSNRGRHIHTLKNTENKKTTKHFDKDIQTRLNKSILNTVEHFLLQNIPTDNIFHVKNYSVTKCGTLLPKIRYLKNIQETIEPHRGRYLTEECLNLEIDNAKIKYLNDTKNVQDSSNAPDFREETKANYEGIPIQNRKYRIVTRYRKNPIKTQKPKVPPQCKTNLHVSNSSNVTWYYDKNGARIKNNEFSVGKQQCHKKNSTIHTHKPCMCTLKLKPKKYCKDTQETALCRHSYNVLSRTSSEPNISSRRSMKQYAIETNQASRDCDFEVKSNSVHSISQIEHKYAPYLTPDNFAMITKPNGQLELKMSSRLDICASNPTKASIDTHFHESDHITEAMKRVHRGSDKEKVIQHKLSQVSSSTAKSRHIARTHKLRRCLCKLKLIRPKNKKVKQMTRPTGAQSIHQSDSRSHLPCEQKERSHTRWEHGYNQLLHKVELETICNNKCMIRSVCAIKPSVTPTKNIKVPSSWKPHKNEVPLKILRRNLPSKVISLCHLQAEVGTSLGMNFENQMLNGFSSLDLDVPFEHQKALEMHRQNFSVTQILKENTEQKDKLLMIKTEKEKKCSLGPAKKGCLCTLKHHKKNRNSTNHNTASAPMKTVIIKEKNCPDLEDIKFSTVLDIPTQNNRAESMLIKSHLQEKNIATENKQLSKKSLLKTCNKTFGATPRLKRCFCTLQFLKKDQQNKLNMFTCVKVGPCANYNVITPKITLPNKDQLLFNSNHATKAQYLANQCHLNDKLSSTLSSVSTVEYKSITKQSYLKKSEFKLLRLYSDNDGNLSSKKILSFESKLGFEGNCHKSINMPKESDVDSYNLLGSRKKRKFCEFSNCNVKLDTSPSHLTGIRPLLRRCYCTMNIQIAHRGQTHSNKLKPYECEPGICVPYECDPIKCQKLIMKRLMKKSSTMTKTELNSSSSSTELSGARNKKLQSSEAHEPERVERTSRNVTHESPQRREQFQPSGKQVVRLGSSLNFNVEFFKDSNPRKSSIKERKPSMFSRFSGTNYKKIRTEGTKGMGHKQHDMESQSAMMKMRHRTSGVKPMVKRCFCTLKLQKKGREQQKPLNINQQGTSTQTKMEIVPVAMESSQNTIPEKPTKIQKLLPYECEPGICVPGQCEPHACLKLINKRVKKNKGTNSMRSNIISSSSMTAKRKMQIKAKHIQSDIKSHGKQIKFTHGIQSKPENTSISPSRQVVRVGSSFSFNVEFYKDRLTDSDQKPRPQKKLNHEVKSGPRYKDKRTEGKHISFQSHDSQATLPNKEDKALGVKLMLKRCFCTLKLQKQTEPTNKAKKDKVLIANSSTGTTVRKPVPDLNNISVMTVHKFKPHGHKLMPYKCEPGVCVPGRCDPYECEKRTKKRLMNRGSSTKQRGTRSVSSSAKRARKVKDRNVTIKQKRSEILEPIKEMKVEPNKLFSRPSGQVVRIGSNFSFNIEFYKNNSPGGTTEPAPYQNTTADTTSKIVTSVYPATKNRKVQRVNATRDMDSHMLAKNMRTTMTGVTPFLKRCFCTLKLQKPNNEKTPVQHKAVVTNTQKNREKPNIYGSDKSTKTKKASIQGRKLEPYECEPRVCIPGECDPYEGSKRIKIRELKSKRVSTARRKRYSVASLASKPSKSWTKTTQVARKSVYTSQANGRSTVREHKQYSSSPLRQVVRIGSSFRFNVEFSKDNSLHSPCSPECIPVCKPMCPKASQKTRYSKTTGTKPTIAKSVSTYSGAKSESKETGVSPTFKRCFCTLKLQKLGSQQQKSKRKSDTGPKHIGTSTPIKKKPEIVIAGKEVGTKTEKERVIHNLLPYECEPGVCIPGQCDPNECLLRIKQRQTKNFGTETKNTKKSFTRNKQIQSKKAQKHKDKVVNEKRVKKLQTCLCPEQPPSPPPPPPQPSQPSLSEPSSEDRNRQVVRIGSNFSFNIEFYKDRNGSPFQSPQQNKSLASISTSNYKKRNDRGSFCGGKNCRHIKSQAASVKTESKGSSMGPLLKRCFCTLALQKMPAHPTNKYDTKSIKKPKVPTGNKTTSTKKNKNPPVKRMHLEPYECEPGVCVPGKCNPYECLERIKKRDISRKLQTSEAHDKSKKLQTNIKESSKVDTQNDAMIVEQPRFPLLFDRSNRQVVRISSNFSFNIEFFKDVSPTTAPNDRKQTNCSVISDSKKGKHDTNSVQTATKKKKCEKKCGRCDNLQSCQSQSDSPRAENKSSGVGKLLKRCFCTAKLGSPYGLRTVTVGRVDNNVPLLPYMQKKYWVQYLTQQLTTKQQDEVNLNKQCHCLASRDPKNMKSKTKNSAEMKTILPYSPNKFNKNKSNYVIRNECTQQACHLDLSKANKNGDVSKKPNLKGAKRLTVKASNSDIIDGTIQTKVQKSPLKELVCRCLQIFSKHKNKPTNFANNNTTGNPVASFKSDYLNLSKSERQSEVGDTNTFPKQSKSLKVTKVNDKKADSKKNKFSRFQSGDNGQIQNAMQIYCLRCHAPYNQTNKPQPQTKLVHFVLPPDTKPFREKTEKKNNANNPACIALCPCCGGFKIPKVDPKSNNTASPQYPINNEIFHSPNIMQNDSVNQNKNKSCCCVGRCACSKLKPQPKEKSCRCEGRCLCPKLKSGVIVNKYSDKKCVCGSVECSKEAEKLKNAQKSSRQRKETKPSEPCVCGSKICGAETEKSKRHKNHICECASLVELSKKNAEKNKLAKKQKIALEKEKLLSEKKEKLITEKKAKEHAKMKEKDFLARQARYKKEDAVRKKMRIQKDKKMLKDVKKYKDAGDTMLITESVLDIAKLGFVSAGDIVRCVGKAAIDPKFTFQKVKSTITEPSRAWTKLKSVADESPGISTLKRVQMRLNETSCVKKGREELEKYPATHYMLHMADKNPKHRLLKRKNKRVKVDFNCSPFMLSLRKRPYLAVYLCCPWFYPHCLSLLNVWRQFTDILLFLLAVTVWSPCIFCMEACRALMCCFLCTG